MNDNDHRNCKFDQLIDKKPQQRVLTPSRESYAPTADMPAVSRAFFALDTTSTTRPTPSGRMLGWGGQPLSKMPYFFGLPCERLPTR